MINLFDFKTALLAKHAQHVVLIHFPIALFTSAVVFDLTAQWTKLRGLTDAAYYNLLVAAISTFPVFATGIVAWQMSTAFPQPAPGTAPSAGPMKVPADQLQRVLGITDVNYLVSGSSLAIVDSPLGDSSSSASGSGLVVVDSLFG